MIEHFSLIGQAVVSLLNGSEGGTVVSPVQENPPVSICGKGVIRSQVASAPSKLKSADGVAHMLAYDISQIIKCGNGIRVQFEQCFIGSPRFGIIGLGFVKHSHLKETRNVLLILRDHRLKLLN